MANLKALDVRTVSLVMVFPLVLGACGSSSSTDPTVPPVEPPPTRASFDQLASLGKSLFDEQIDIDYTPNANIPVSGTATYSGAAAYKTDSSIPPNLGYPDYDNAILTNPEFVSDVKLTANFGTSSITGLFSNFHSATAGPLDGSLTLENGRIDRTLNVGTDVDGFDTYGFSGDISGAVGSPGAVRPAIGTTGGNFVGGGAEYVLGYIGVDSLAIDTGEKIYGVYTAKK